MTVIGSAKHLLEVSDLSIRYGEVDAVRDVGFVVDEGEVVVLLGANGAGKTTTVRGVVGLSAPHRGSIRIDGRETRGRKTHEISKLGVRLSPEGRLMFPTLTVRENLVVGGYAIRGRKEMNRQIDHWLDRFPRLRERSAQRADSLSGGEQQMLAIARALMSKPRLLLLDEPSLGMAPLIIDELQEIVLNIVRTERVAVLLVEQNVRLALALADRGYVLQQGRVVASGLKEEIGSLKSLTSAYMGGES